MARQVESRGQIGQLDGEEPGAPGGAAPTAGQSRPLSRRPRFGGRVLEAGPPPRRKSPHCRAAQGTEAVPPPWVQEAGMLVSKQVGRLHFPSLRTWSRHAGQRPARIQSLRPGCSLPTQTQRGDTRGPSPHPARSATILSWTLGTEEWLVLQKQPGPRRKPRSCAQPSRGSHSAHGPAETRRSLSVWGLRFLNG